MPARPRCAFFADPVLPCFPLINPSLDCGWTTGYRENVTGELQADPAKFADMAAFGEAIRARGLILGMYAGGWKAQCCNRGKRGGNDTSWNHWDIDAAQFAKR